MCEDSYIWIMISDGSFKVKSAYDLILELITSCILALLWKAMNSSKLETSCQTLVPDNTKVEIDMYSTAICVMGFLVFKHFAAGVLLSSSSTILTELLII